MTPRLANSKKWTALPPELCSQIREIFEESFPEEAKRGELQVEGRIYSQELMLQIGYIEKGRLQQANFETSLDFDPKKQNALELIHLAIDCAASMMQEFFEVEQSLDGFPRAWHAFDLDGKKVFLQVSTVNTKLETEADKLLGEKSDDLVHGEDEDEEKSAAATMLGLTDLENDIEIEDIDNEEKTDEKIPKSKPKTRKTQLH